LQTIYVDRKVVLVGRWIHIIIDKNQKKTYNDDK